MTGSVENASDIEASLDGLRRRAHLADDGALPVRSLGTEKELVQHEQRVRAHHAALSRELAELSKQMPSVAKDRRKDVGRAMNDVKQALEHDLERALASIAARRRQLELEGPRLDWTLPGRRPLPGKLHPITRVTHDLLDIFRSIGFDVAQGPEIELHDYNFDRLGFPPDHPATDMQDSFFVSTARPEAKPLLRTHTSNVQVREMLSVTQRGGTPPIAVVCPGAVYRRDDDATHSPMFHQLEGLLVDDGVDFADLKGVLTLFLRRLFGPDAKVRFRPSYFPFVEPGGEVDVWRGDRWMEILGCGMVDPVVFEHVGIDPERYTGFAFGMGLDRIAMLKYGVDNIRTLFDNDIRFLSRL